MKLHPLTVKLKPNIIVALYSWRQKSKLAASRSQQISPKIVKYH